MRLSFWLNRLFSSFSVRPRKKKIGELRRRLPRDVGSILELLEDRSLLAFNLSIGTATTAGVSSVDSGGNRTFTATATGATINVADIQAGFLSDLNVVISNGSTGTETGSISWNSALDYNGFSGTQTLTINTDASSTSASVTLNDQSISDSTPGGEVLNVVINAHNGVLLSGANAEVATNGGSFTVNADSDADGAGGFSLNNASSSVSATGGAISITAADIDLSGSISGTGLVTLAQSLSGATIDLGSTGGPTSGKLELSDTELDHVTAGTLQIGDINSGTITVSAAITHANNLLLTTGAGITVNQAITMAANKSLTVSAVGTINLATGNSYFATTGTGAISLTTQRDIILGSGASITTVDGALMLSANQQTTATSGNFVGVDVNGGLIQVTGTGTLTVLGKGGDASSDSQIGVRLRNGGDIIGGTTGLVTVQGTGGASSFSSNHGVHVHDVGSEITSTGADVSVTGTGGGIGDSGGNAGVIVAVNGRITAGLNGDVTVVGTGGNLTGGGHFNVGVYIYDTEYTNSTITSSGGNVSVTGTGGGTGSSGNNIGVFLLNGDITAGGNGAVTVVGTGGTLSTGDGQEGVSNQAGLISSSGGNVSVTGTGGGAGNSSYNSGVAVYYSGTISAGGSGSVTVVGTGGNLAGTGGINHGVTLHRQNSPISDATITSSGGNVSVTGTRGGNGSTSFGVDVAYLGTISTATHGGTVTLISDSMRFGTTANISAQSGSSVTLLQKTNGVAIDLGGSDAASTLGLTDAELGQITAGTVNIGNTNSGTMTVSAPITAALGGKNNLVLTTGAGITADQAITMAANKSLTANAVGTISLATSDSDFATTGTGAISLTTQRDIVMASGSSVTTVNGSLTLSANQQMTATSGDFTGIRLISADVHSTGTGTVTLEGRGGDSSSGHNLGIWVSGSNGNIATISSADGDVLITGTGVGGAISDNNMGVFLTGYTLVSAGDDVVITGMGGTTTGSGNIGVRISDASTQVVSTGGDITITGTGGGSTGSGGHHNEGVALTYAGVEILGSATGNVTITGHGGFGTGADNFGIEIFAGIVIQSGGDITLTGTEGEGPGLAIKMFDNGGSISTTGAGNISLVGDSMEIGTGVTINAGTRTVSVQVFTAGTAINLGSGSNPIGGPLSLTDTELDAITAGTVNVGNANSGTITVSAAITHANNLSLTTGAGITVSQAITMTTDKNFSATTTSTTAAINLATTNSDIAATGTGTISLTASRDLLLATDSSLTTVNGNLTVSANQQVTATSGDFVGVKVAGVIAATGTGAVSVSGRGGDSGSATHQIGVWVNNGRIGHDTEVVGAGTVTVDWPRGSFGRSLQPLRRVCLG